MTLAELQETYGIFAPDSNKFSRLPDSSNYTMDRNTQGISFAANDRIGVLLEFGADDKGSLTFFKNGKLVGKLYENMKAGTYLPCVSMSAGKNVVTLLSCARMP